MLSTIIFHLLYYISFPSQDKQEKERQDAKNNLEEYVYEMRSKCSEEYEKFVKEEDREKFVQLLDATEEWLYDEGEEQSRGVYVAKLTDLKKIGQPIVDRSAFLCLLMGVNWEGLFVWG